MIGADLSSTYLPRLVALRQIVPQTGAFEAYKLLANGQIAHLRIPAEAARLGGLLGRKCRAEFVEVISGEGASTHDPSFLYAPGKTVRPHEWCDDVREECAGGIHFYLTQLEAEEHR